MHSEFGADDPDIAMMLRLQRKLEELERRLNKREAEISQLKRRLNEREEQLQMLQREVETLENQCLTLVEESKRQIKQLQLLLSLTAGINSSLELRSVLSNILSAAEEITGAEASSILLVSDTGELVFEVVTGESGGVLKRVSLRLGEGIAGYVAETGKPIIVDDVTKDKRHKRGVDEVTGFKTRNLLAVPLRLNDKVIGVIEVVNKRGEESFDEADLKDLMLLAELSAIAIDKARKHEALQELFISSIRALAAALDARDPYTHGHSERVTQFTLAIAEELGMDEESKKRLELSALLHDIGKVGVEDAVLKKPGKLTEEEYELMKTHPEKGYHILRLVRQLEPHLPGVRYHHEHFDGSGYPLGLKGDEIPLDARIIAVADVFDALTSNRPYRDAYKPEDAIKMMHSEVGKHFDPKVFDAFMRAYEKGKIKPHGS
ncbi:MAG: GAF domain-containing protein [Armatimonadota bacterium]|nr:GAF domain-containing protein [Armatimonadota bacterium]MCX7778290.1 GAF domain-containing protein [Armatimonadota bacterium]MDW8026322.1 GAF domain-containing protein [Armatimonadota bacterium]